MGSDSVIMDGMLLGSETRETSPLLLVERQPSNVFMVILIHWHWPFQSWPDTPTLTAYTLTVTTLYRHRERYLIGWLDTIQQLLARQVLQLPVRHTKLQPCQRRWKRREHFNLLSDSTLNNCEINITFKKEWLATFRKQKNSHFPGFIQEHKFSWIDFSSFCCWFNDYLTIRPRGRMDYESIAHEVRMGYSNL